MLQNIFEQFPGEIEAAMKSLNKEIKPEVKKRLVGRKETNQNTNQSQIPTHVDDFLTLCWNERSS